MKKALAAFLLVMLMASPAYPWGAQGHAAIGLVAEHYLNADTQRHIEKILGSDDLASIASWMDQVLGVSKGFGPLASSTEAHQFAERYPHSNLWHYVDLPLGETRYTDNDPFSRADDVVHELNIAVAVLEGKSTAVPKRVAIYMIVHFVGDMHQPLHVACGYYDLTHPEHPVLVTDPKAAAHLEDDKGGNVLRYGNERRFELHAYWDSVLPEKAAGSSDPSVLAGKLLKMMQPQAWAPTGDHHSWGEAWATESIMAAREAYAGITFGPATLANGKIDFIPITLPAGYDASAVPLAEKRMAQAGFHLAELLNAIAWSDQN